MASTVRNLIESDGSEHSSDSTVSLRVSTSTQQDPKTEMVQLETTVLNDESYNTANWTSSYTDGTKPEHAEDSLEQIRTNSTQHISNTAGFDIVTSNVTDGATDPWVSTNTVEVSSVVRLNFTSSFGDCNGCFNHTGVPNMVHTDEVTKHIMGAMLALLATSGIVLNTLIIIAYLWSKHCRKPHHLFILSIAISNTFVSAIYMPVLLANLFAFSKLILAPMWLKQIWSIVTLASLLVSLITMVTLIINRYIRHCTSSSQYLHFFSQTRTLVYVFSIWICSFVLVLLTYTLIYTKNQLDPFYGILLPENVNQKYELLMVFFSILATLTVLILMLSLMLLCVIRNATVHPASSVKASTKQYMYYANARTSAVCLTVTYICCYIPNFVVHTLLANNINVLVPVHSACYALLLSSCMLTSVVYTYQVPEFKRAIHAIWLCVSPNKRSGEQCASRDLEYMSDFLPSHTPDGISITIPQNAENPTSDTILKP